MSTFQVFLVPSFPSSLLPPGFHLHSDQVKFSMMLTQLQNSPVFRLREFEGTVEYIRNIVAQVMYILCVSYMPRNPFVGTSLHCTMFVIYLYK